VTAYRQELMILQRICGRPFSVLGYNASIIHHAHILHSTTLGLCCTSCKNFFTHFSSRWG